MGACGSLGAECRVARHVMGRPGAQTEVAPATGLVRQGALRTSAGASERTTAVAALTSSPPSKKGEDSYEAWFGFNQSTFGGFLFHRSALLRRISEGFPSGLPGPRSCDKRTIHQNLRLISPFSRTEPYGASGMCCSPNSVKRLGRAIVADFPRIRAPGHALHSALGCEQISARAS